MAFAGFAKPIALLGATLRNGQRSWPTGRAAAAPRAPWVAVVITACLLAGCTSARQWWHNGLKVGPNYSRPPAPAADTWIDADQPTIISDQADFSHWWTVFNDPVLQQLVETAYVQNLTLRSAGLRIEEARAQRAFAAGLLFPQQQALSGAYARSEISDNAFPFGAFPIRKHFSDWLVGFDASWELDLWGQIRRGIESADANLDAQVENYDAVLVTLQGEVAATYIQMRALEERLVLARHNVELQEGVLKIIQKRYEGGVLSELDVRQASAILAVTRSLIPILQQSHRKTQNALCILLGIPPRDLREELGAPRPAIPGVPAQVVVGIPADLLRRRPDIRAAERATAAQSARIGIATAELYPHFEITGTIALQAQNVDDLFDWRSLTGSVGPRFRWNILNYGRIVNGIRVEEARFQRTAVDYQNTVLNAQREVEDGIVSFLREQSRLEDLRQAVDDTQRALELGLLLYQQGIVGYQRVLDAQRALVLQQDSLAATQGKVALNLVAIYKALGGGWQMRCQDAANEALPPLPAAASIPHDTPVPLPSLGPLVEPIDAPAVENPVKRIPASGDDPPGDDPPDAAPTSPARLPTVVPKPPSSATDDSDADDPAD